MFLKINWCYTCDNYLRFFHCVGCWYERDPYKKGAKYSHEIKIRYIPLKYPILRSKKKKNNIQNQFGKVNEFSQSGSFLSQSLNF